MLLTTGQTSALQNLARKKTGGEVGWIGIADARALADLGLARRNASGWRITEEGEAQLRGRLHEATVIAYDFARRG